MTQKLLNKKAVRRSLTTLAILVGFVIAFAPAIRVLADVVATEAPAVETSIEPDPALVEKIDTAEDTLVSFGEEEQGDFTLFGFVDVFDPNGIGIEGVVIEISVNGVYYISITSGDGGAAFYNSTTLGLHTFRVVAPQGFEVLPEDTGVIGYFDNTEYVIAEIPVTLQPIDDNGSNGNGAITHPPEGENRLIQITVLSPLTPFPIPIENAIITLKANGEVVDVFENPMFMNTTNSHLFSALLQAEGYEDKYITLVFEPTLLVGEWQSINDVYLVPSSDNGNGGNGDNNNGNGNNDNNGNGNNGTESGNDKGNAGGIQTGDNTAIIIFIFLIIFSGLIGRIAVKKSNLKNIFKPTQ